MGALAQLSALLHRIDGQGYGAYKRCKGTWDGRGLSLRVDHVQGDPFATPSRLRLILPPEAHGIPDSAWETDERRIGLEDYLLRRFGAACEQIPRVSGSGRSGEVTVTVDSPMVLDRAGCSLAAHGLELRFRVGLPARGRRCLGRAAAELLTEHLPAAAESVRWSEVDQQKAWSWIHTTEDHGFLQGSLAGRGLVAFVRNGSVLPRSSGVSAAPLDEAVRFQSPVSMQVTLPTLHHGDVMGMGIPAGVTVLTGGGFHGKTTLLEAIQHGVAPHIPGDGREWTVTVSDAVKVRSEDGRSIAGVNLSPFIRNLPFDRDTRQFITPDASGSTSLAADIMEALEIGTSLLLMDEDTCATNLLVRDARMQDLVLEETIVPFIDRVRELLDQGVSTILVTGGGGDYLDVADFVLLMEDYLPRDATAEAAAVAHRNPTGRSTGVPENPLRARPRIPRKEGLDPRKRSGKVVIKTRGVSTIQYGGEDIDLTAIDQLVDYGQARAIGALIGNMHRECDGRQPLAQLIRASVERVSREGLYALEDSPELAQPRAQELAKAVNRLRSLTVLPDPDANRD
jgi:predicted ABC-class ATPase